jgi:cytochrome bd-type quinol oxidase subunit 2
MPTLQKLSGLGRLLVAVYAVFAVSSSARALYQLITKFEEAPLAYSLSAFAAVIYVIATLALAKPKYHRLALATIVFELVGVIAVGILSFTYPELFAHPSVWSKFGQGYGYIPLVLPVLGLLWLRKNSKI